MELMKLNLFPSQYKLLSRYCEDLSKAALLSTAGGYFLPSVLPSAIRPTLSEAAFGGIVSLTLLLFSIKFVKKGEK